MSPKFYRHVIISTYDSVAASIKLGLINKFLVLTKKFRPIHKKLWRSKVTFFQIFKKNMVSVFLIFFCNYLSNPYTILYQNVVNSILYNFLIDRKIGYHSESSQNFSSQNVSNVDTFFSTRQNFNIRLCGPIENLALDLQDLYRSEDLKSISWGSIKLDIT
jgi:hypothetical protein